MEFSTYEQAEEFAFNANLQNFGDRVYIPCSHQNGTGYAVAVEYQGHKLGYVGDPVWSYIAGKMIELR